MTTSDDEAHDQMLGLEANALSALSKVTKAAVKAMKGHEHLGDATASLVSAVSASVVGSCATVRVAAAKQFADATGIDVTTSGTDDAERGTKAAAYYVKVWTKAMPSGYGGGGGSSGGGGASASWDDAVEMARVDSEPTLARVASYEVALAWNDEHRRNAKALPDYQFEERWYTRNDEHVCAICKRMNGTHADTKGEFPNGWPPVHGDCRCIVISQVVGAPKEHPMPTNTHELRTGGHDELVHCSLDCTIKSFDEKARTVDVVMSTARVDRHGERVALDWDVKAYKQNPVVLWAHDSRSPPIGRCENVRIEGNALVGTIRFCSATANPLAEQCVQLFREGMLNSVSVGFIPHSMNWEKEDDRDILILSQNELVELSVTPTPANPDALARRRAKALAMREGAEGSGRPVVSASGRVLGHTVERGAPTKTTPELRAPSLPTNDSAAKGATETTMTEAEIKALQEKSALAVATAQLAEKNATEARTRAESNALAAETKIKALETERETLAAEKAALTKEHTKASEDRDAAIARAEKAESGLIALEVDVLVGKKISAAEKDDFIALRKNSPELFTSMVAKRAPMNLETEITEAGKKNGTAPANGDASDLLAEFQKSAGL